jgi:hypothetical protein
LGEVKTPNVALDMQTVHIMLALLLSSMCGQVHLWVSAAPEMACGRARARGCRGRSDNFLALQLRGGGPLDHLIYPDGRKGGIELPGATDSQDASGSEEDEEEDHAVEDDLPKDIDMDELVEEEMEEGETATVDGEQLDKVCVSFSICIYAYMHACMNLPSVCGFLFTHMVDHLCEVQAATSSDDSSSAFQHDCATL